MSIIAFDDFVCGRRHQNYLPYYLPLQSYISIAKVPATISVSPTAAFFDSRS